MNGERIKQERMRRGMSQRQLAEKVGISQPALKKIESGQTSRSRYMNEIEKYLGLMGVEGEPREASVLKPGIPAFPIFGCLELPTGDFAMTEKPIHQQAPIAAVLPDVFGFYVRGDSMFPRYREGEILLVNPYQPPRPGDGVLLTNTDGKRRKVKELVRVTHSHWIVRTIMPEKELKLPRSEWPSCELIFAVYSRT